MVSTRNKVSGEKEAGQESQDVGQNQIDLATILEGQAKMQQEFVEFKKHNADEMEALR